MMVPSKSKRASVPGPVGVVLISANKSSVVDTVGIPRALLALPIIKLLQIMSCYVDLGWYFIATSAFDLR
jgi:hypothetical protein